MAAGRTIKISGATNTGNVRSHNEDAILIDCKRGLGVVADGMGGHASGEVASRITVAAFAQHFDDAVPLHEILLQAHADIIASAAAQPESAGMGATAVAALVDTEHFHIAWVGDSRVYHWRPGHLRQISRDHSYLELLLRSGEITEEQARNHPQRNVVTQALGLNSPQPESLQESWQAGDRLLLCSDGLTDELDSAEIKTVLDASEDIQSATSALIGAALKNGGRDNVSVVLIENSNGNAVGSGRGLIIALLGMAVIIGVIAIWLAQRN